MLFRSLFLSSSHRHTESRERLAGNSKECENIHLLLGFRLQQHSYAPNELIPTQLDKNTEIFLYLFIEYVIMISLILKLGMFQNMRFCKSQC